MNLLKFWFLRTIHPTTNKKPKSKYASYIFFSQKTRRYFMYLSSQKSLTRRIRCRLFWTSLFEVLTSYFKSQEGICCQGEKLTNFSLIPKRNVRQFVTLERERVQQGEVLNESYEQIEQAAQDSRKVLECYDHTASKYVQEKCPKK